MSDDSVRSLTRREALQGGSAVVASTVGLDALTARAMAQSGGPTNEISGTVEDDNGAVQGATVAAVPHDTSLAVLETTTAADGTYTFDENTLHSGENLYHVIARDGTESDPRRGVQNYPFIAAEGAAAIPDSEANQKLAHRWVLTDDSGSLGVADSIGSADGTNNGVSLVTGGDYAGGAAGDGDGTDDHIATTTWGTFGSNMDSDFAIAFSIHPPASEAVVLGTANSDGSGDNSLYIRTDDAFNGSLGTLTWAIRGDGDGGAFNAVESTTDLTSGGPYRVVVNKTGNSASDMQIWVNQADDNASTIRDQFDETTVIDFNEAVALFAANTGGTIQGYLSAILDDICVFGNSLTQSEIESYTNPWP